METLTLSNPSSLFPHKSTSLPVNMSASQSWRVGFLTRFIPLLAGTGTQSSICPTQYTDCTNAISGISFNFWKSAQGLFSPVPPTLEMTGHTEKIGNVTGRWTVGLLGFCYILHLLLGFFLIGNSMQVCTGWLLVFKDWREKWHLSAYSTYLPLPVSLFLGLWAPNQYLFYSYLETVSCQSSWATEG